MSKNHFSPFQINTIICILWFFCDIGCPKLTFERISGHFRSICNFNFFLIFDKMTAVDHISGHFRSIFFFLNILTKWPPALILDIWNSLSIAFLAIPDRYATLIFLENFDKMAAVGHFGCPKFTSDRISGHFRSIRKFYFFWKFLTKWLPSAILDVRNSLSIAFLAILDQYF